MVSQPPALVHHEKNQACGESVQFEVPVSALNTANPERTLQEIMVSRPLLPQALDTDSSKIVFVCEKIFPPQLCIRYVQSGRVEQLTKDLDFYEIKSPKWKPGGEAIYFTAIRWTWDDYSLYTIRKDGTGLNWEIWDQFSIIEAVWSPDETIYYIRDDCRVLRWVYPTERGHDNRILTGVPCFTSFSLSWSNTSNSQIAFVGWPGPTLSPTLWVAGKSPGDQRQIYQFPDPQSSYDWIEVSWNQEGDRVYAYFSQAGITKGILVDPFSAKDEPVSVFWETPVWWKPDFYPQWGK